MEGTCEGGCLCGTVRYRILGAPRWVAHCHCASCRRQTGAAFATYAGVPRANYAVLRGEARRHTSSPGVARSFCGACGSPLTYEGERWPDEVHVHVGTLDRPEAMTPRIHVYVETQLPWLRLADGLPRYPRTTRDSEPLP